jgi:hypothetical protein
MHMTLSKFDYKVKDAMGLCQSLRSIGMADIHYIQSLGLHHSTCSSLLNMLIRQASAAQIRLMFFCVSL